MSIELLCVYLCGVRAVSLFCVCLESGRLGGWARLAALNCSVEVFPSHCVELFCVYLRAPLAASLFCVLVLCPCPNCIISPLPFFAPLTLPAGGVQLRSIHNEGSAVASFQFRSPVDLGIKLAGVHVRSSTLPPQLTAR